ncbi:MAG: YicC family protein [Bacteroidia bacterium]|nr:MAG: YicC family protein [Bacteroidia bacterium]
MLIKGKPSVIRICFFGTQTIAMIKSMTGFGKSQCQFENKVLNIEVKSLNGKTLDINLKIPGIYRSKEHDIRSLMARHLLRGKTELIIQVEGQNHPANYSLNKVLMEKYYAEIRAFAKQMGHDSDEELIPAILRLPDVVQQEAQHLTEEEWQVLVAGISEALEECDNFRVTEGLHLADDIRLRIEAIGALMEKINPLEEERHRSLRQRFVRQLETLNDIASPDPNRFEQELLYYIEKLDITEELVRLQKHLAYFTQTIDEPGSAGKKLGFISQEIGREINTIGSKANDAAIQRIVVEMKDELEKIKEQLMNIL